MKAIKIINIFKAKENIPFMTCLITSMEENEKGINLTLENDENICIKDYGYYFLSEAARHVGSAASFLILSNIQPKHTNIGEPPSTTTIN